MAAPLSAAAGGISPKVALPLLCLCLSHVFLHPSVMAQEDEQMELCSSHRDHDLDGQWDTSFHYEYDASHHLIQRARLGSPTICDRNTVYQYDPDGHCVEEITEGSCPLSESQTTYTWADGLLQRIDVDRQRDGDTDLRRIFTYDDQDRLTLEEFDRRADGTIDRCAQILFDDQGRRSRETMLRGCEVIEWSESFTYDDRGLLTLVTHFRAGSDSPEWIRRHEYDEEGGLIKETTADGVDGQINLECRFEDHDEGQIRWCDAAAEGTDSVTLFDAEGRELLELTDEFGDGWVNSIVASHIETNENGQIIGEQQHLTSHSVEQIWTYRYDQLGCVTAIHFHDTLAGTREDTTYQPSPCLGPLLDTLDWDRAAFSTTIAEQKVDLDGDGIADLSIQRDYGSPCQSTDRLRMTNRGQGEVLFREVGQVPR